MTLAERQAAADQNFAPVPFGNLALLAPKDPIVWRNGVGLPLSYVRSLPSLPEGMANQEQH